MADSKQELQTKKEKSSSEVEYTRNRKVFSPNVDIAEIDDNIVLIADMPGVDEKSVDVVLEKNILTITGTVEPEHFEGYEAAYSEYDIGDYRRVFEVSSDVDGDKIEATVKNGILKLVLPKAEPVKTKKIKVNAA
jgi:HSP20 family molecular chaperone IbpA